MGIKYIIQNQNKVDNPAWDVSDKNNYYDSTSRKVGQIGENNIFQYQSSLRSGLDAKKKLLPSVVFCSLISVPSCFLPKQWPQELASKSKLVSNWD